jgi:hypothetical protein
LVRIHSLLFSFLFLHSLIPFFFSPPSNTLRWDGEKDSLSATLYRARPDVFPVSTASPIPSEMPLDFGTVCLIMLILISDWLSHADRANCKDFEENYKEWNSRWCSISLRLSLLLTDCTMLLFGYLKIFIYLRAPYFFLRSSDKFHMMLLPRYLK